MEFWELLSGRGTIEVGVLARSVGALGKAVEKELWIEVVFTLWG
jgi:hypothetical protein